MTIPFKVLFKTGKHTKKSNFVTNARVYRSLKCLLIRLVKFEYVNKNELRLKFFINCILTLHKFNY